MGGVFTGSGGEPGLAALQESGKLDEMVVDPNAHPLSSWNAFGQPADVDVDAAAFWSRRGVRGGREGRGVESPAVAEEVVAVKVLVVMELPGP